MLHCWVPFGEGVGSYWLACEVVIQQKAGPQSLSHIVAWFTPLLQLALYPSNLMILMQKT